MPKFFFDISDLGYFVEVNSTLTGIQRVVINVARKMAQKHGADNVLLCFLDHHVSEKPYRVIDSRILLDSEDLDIRVLRAALVSGPAVRNQNVHPIIQKYADKPLKRRFHMFKAKYHATRGDEKYFAKRKSSVQEWIKYHANNSPEQELDAQKIRAKYRLGVFADFCEPGDQLSILGAGWASEWAEETLTSAKALGAKIQLMVYDLIPLVNPEHTGFELTNHFSPWVRKTTEYVDNYMAISEFTASQFRQYLREIGCDQPVTAVPLAQQFPIADAPDRSALIIKDRFGEIKDMRPSTITVTSRPYVLVVGTMESRKNNLGIAQAWESLLRENDLDMPRLVFAGKRGWENSSFFNWMKTSGNMNGWVEIVEMPSDLELAFLYKHCEFTAMVSYTEGWGLPIGESLSYGKTAVVAKNTSMPEVGGDMVEYCEAQSVKSIARACRRLIDDLDHRRMLEARISSTRLRTWDDVTEDFSNHLSQ